MGGQGPARLFPVLCFPFDTREVSREKKLALFVLAAGLVLAVLRFQAEVHAADLSGDANRGQKACAPDSLSHPRMASQDLVG